MEYDQEQEERVDLVKDVIRAIVDFPDQTEVAIFALSGSVKSIAVQPANDSDFRRLIGRHGATYYSLVTIVSFLFRGHVLVKIEEPRGDLSPGPPPDPVWDLSTWEKLFFRFVDLWLGERMGMTADRKATTPEYKIRTTPIPETDRHNVSRVFQSIAKHHGGLVRVRIN